MHEEPKKFFAMYVRNFIFGVEDSLVSTVGLLAGIATAGVAPKTIILIGVILIFVEAFSMAVGSFLSECSAEEYISREGIPIHYFVVGGFIMFFSYFISGFIPLFPYIIFQPTYALGVSILLSLATLFLLGAVSAKAFGVRIMRSGFRMLLVGGGAVIIGALVGGFIG